MPIHGYPGNVITANPVAPTSTVATGVWTTEQQLQATSAGNWPRPGPPQPISRSLRFNSADSAYLNRTLTTPTDGKRWTWSGWVKRGILTNGTGTAQQLFSAGSATAFFRFSTTDTLISGWTGATNLETTQVFRDASAWYHIMLVVDTTQATASNRVKYYVNGSQITAFSSTDYPTQNSTTTINSAVAHNIGAYQSSSQYFNGYMTEINFVDGQALTPSSFGQNNAATGVWEPIPYTGTYGTNGFYLNFSDNSNTTAATLGKDYSGNGNNWTPNNFSVTAGAGNDSMVDSPTSYGTDTGVGGEVRGNYATWNPLVKFSFGTSYAGTYSNGNLDIATGGNSTQFAGTMGLFDGCYWEVTATSIDASRSYIGIVATQSNMFSSSSAVAYNGTYNVLYSNDGNVYVNTTSGSNIYGAFATWTNNDVISVAFKDGKIYFAKNGTWINSGVPASGTGFVASGWNAYGTLLAYAGYNSNYTGNFGQRAFAYTAPSGFKALCTQNLTTPTIGATSTTQANDYFNAVTFSGNGSAGSVTGVGFQPDFIWAKNRTNAYNHELWDAIRGVNSTLFSNSTAAQDTTANRLVSFNSDGFSYGTSSNLYVNATNSVAWNWKANGAGSSNTAGTITSTVSANTTSGFSIVTYTGTNVSGATVGHGLGAVPAMIIIKNRSSLEAWPVYHAYNTSAPETDYLVLNTTAATADATTPWNDTLPTSTVFTLGNWNALNENGSNHVAYCFAPVAGYSAFGSYTGNGSTDGPFVYLGFRPRFLLLKISSTTGDWAIYDTSRNTYNVMGLYLYPNSSAAEGGSGTPRVDALSNGFKLRNSGQDNTSSATYIYAAFAESPFKYSLAR